MIVRPAAPADVPALADLARRTWADAFGDTVSPDDLAAFLALGISVLTTVGLHRYYAEQANLPVPMDICGNGVSRCAELTRLLQEAGLTQVRTIFAGGAVCCLVAAVLAVVLFRTADTRRIQAQRFAEPLP